MLKRTLDTCLNALKVIGIKGPWRGPISISKRLLCGRLGVWGFSLQDGGRRGFVYLTPHLYLKKRVRCMSMFRVLIDWLRRVGLRISLHVWAQSSSGPANQSVS